MADNNNTQHIVSVSYTHLDVYKRQDLPPLAFGADAPVAVGAGVSPVVDVAPVEEGIVLAVGHDELMKPLGGLHGKAHLRLALHLSLIHI